MTQAERTSNIEKAVKTIQSMCLNYQLGDGITEEAFVENLEGFSEYCLKEKGIESGKEKAERESDERKTKNIYLTDAHERLIQELECAIQKELNAEKERDEAIKRVEDLTILVDAQNEFRKVGNKNLSDEINRVVKERDEAIKQAVEYGKILLEARELTNEWYQLTMDEFFDTVEQFLDKHKSYDNKN